MSALDWAVGRVLEPGASPEDAAMHAEAASILRGLVDAIDAGETRAVFVAVELGERTVEQAAALLLITPSAARRYLERGRRKFRQASAIYHQTGAIPTCPLPRIRARRGPRRTPEQERQGLQRLAQVLEARRTVLP